MESGGRLTTAKRIPVPLTFLAVLVLVLALIIFDVDNQRTLAFGLPGTTPALSGANLQKSNSAPYRIARLDDQGAAASDTWWGQAFLRACPLH